MRIRFQADNDLKKAILKGVIRREPAIDFLSAQAARFDRLADADVLLVAATSGRVLVSHDVNTLPGHFRTFLAAGHRSPGVFLVPQETSVADAVESLLLAWLASEASDWENRLVWLPF